MKASSTSDAEPAAQGQVSWGIGVVVLGYVVAVFVSLVSISMVVAIQPDANGGVAAVAASSLGLWAGFATTVLLVAGQGPSRLPHAAKAVGLRVRGVDALIGVPAGIAAQAIGIPAVYWVYFKVFGEADVEGPARALFERGSGAGLVVLTLIVGVGAPLMEEIFFRGLMQRASVRRFGSFGGVAIVALFFAGTHFQVVQFPGLLLAGIVFGVLAHRAGRLGPAICAHVGFNLTTVVTLLVTTP